MPFAGGDRIRPRERLEPVALLAHEQEVERLLALWILFGRDLLFKPRRLVFRRLGEFLELLDLLCLHAVRIVRHLVRHVGGEGFLRAGELLVRILLDGLEYLAEDIGVQLLLHGRLEIGHRLARGQLGVVRVHHRPFVDEADTLAGVSLEGEEAQLQGYSVGKSPRKKRDDCRRRLQRSVAAFLGD